MSILIGLKRRRRRRKTGYTKEQFCVFLSFFFRKKLCNNYSLVWTQNFVTVGFISLSISIFVRVSNLSMSMPCHAMMPCHFATSLPQTNQGILRKKKYFVEFCCTLYLPLSPMQPSGLCQSAWKKSWNGFFILLATNLLFPEEVIVEQKTKFDHITSFVLSFVSLQPIH